MTTTTTTEQLRRINSPLDARCACALATFMADQDDADCVRMTAHAFAFSEGRTAAMNYEQMPQVFKGVQLLEDAWVDGLDFEQHRADMAACDGCQDNSLPLCPFHG